MATEHLMKGMTAEDLPNGIRFVRLHYSADPEKTEDWAAKERSTEADPRNWDKQMEMRRVVTEGMPVFPRYVDRTHCPEVGWHRYFDLTPGALLLGGWDAGQTLNPAFILLEFVPNPLRIRALLEVVSTGGETMEEFAPRVTEKLDQVYPGVLRQITHKGDPTIETRSGPTGVTARQVARKYGFEILPSTNDWTKRSSAVAHILSIEGAYEINGLGCPVLRRGFQGQYKYQTSKQGDSMGAGAVLLSPLKNAYSHIQDAHQYPCIDIYDQIKPGGGSWASDPEFLKKLAGKA